MKGEAGKTGKLAFINNMSVRNEQRKYVNQISVEELDAMRGWNPGLRLSMPTFGGFNNAVFILGQGNLTCIMSEFCNQRPDF